MDPDAGDGPRLLHLPDVLFDTAMPFEERKRMLEGVHHMPVSKQLGKEFKEASGLGAEIAGDSRETGWQ